MNWYESIKTDNSVIISSRIRLARNMKKYPFYVKLSNTDSQKMVDELQNEIVSETNYLQPVNVAAKNEWERRALMEKHIVSPEFLRSNKPKGLLVSVDESISIMLNEEDHIRIQTIFPGDEMHEALDMADKIDNLIEEKVEFAFDKDYGYLSSCPTNTGTGLRASFMLHIPLLEKTGQLRNLIQALGKFGMIVRGIYGEGSEPLGNIYQISNQVTMGKSDKDIILSLINVTNQILEKENNIREKVFSEKNSDLIDSIYRAYGTLTHARRLSSKEALMLLSDVRLGFIAGVLDLPKPKLHFYHLMMNIQPGSLTIKTGSDVEAQRDIARAAYLRSMFQEGKIQEN